MFFSNFIVIFLACYLSIENINCIQKKVIISGREIHYRTEGHGEHTLLLIDGTLGDIAANNFLNIYNNIDENKFKVIQVDLLGYGRNQYEKRNYTDKFFFEKDARFLHEVMEALNEKEYSVAGWGYGGTVALVLAGMFPKEIIKVVEWGAKPFISEEIIKQAMSRSNIQNWDTPELIKQLKNHTRDYIIECHKNLADGFRLLLNEKSGNLTQYFSKITVPTLLIHGIKDNYVKLEQPLEIQKIITSARIETLQNASHSLHNDEDFINLIKGFL
ncbi:valacyclovir hydrolase-like [Daktulosphaira vitifoliae]|uniref:valacyclovir hydrolase-like n=1 Tax=Daktulosphaira vitifoliae TaxID=58002 RepID=UPI0021A9CE6B|nr:valacyclovir hydrolase-like [Daktulosphaira vitifoliae]